MLLLGACGGGGTGYGSNEGAGLLSSTGSTAPSDNSMPAVQLPDQTNNSSKGGDGEIPTTLAILISGIDGKMLNPHGVDDDWFNTDYGYGHMEIHQDEAGNIQQLSEFVVDGDTITRDFHGDAYYSMGRWEKGLERDLSVFEQEEQRRQVQDVPTDNTHFLIYKPVATFPASANLTCDGGVFTAPTLSLVFDDMPAQTLAQVLAWPTGSAKLQFSERGAEISVQIEVIRESGPIQLKRTGYIAREQSQQPLIGNLSDKPVFMDLFIGDGGNGEYLLTGFYSTKSEKSRSYHGLLAFRCK